MKHTGSELIFLSQVRRDGTGTDPVNEEYAELMSGDIFDVRGLSMTNQTYIASGFNSFVVKLKPKEKLSEEEKDRTIKGISQMIKNEHRKHSSSIEDWSTITAQKIYALYIKKEGKL